MHTEIKNDQIDGKIFCSHIVYDNSSKHKRPGVLVAHAWRGQDLFAREKAKKLAQLGYVGFAVDLYGNGIIADTDASATALMTPLFTNRALLRKRIVAAHKSMCQHPLVDNSRTGAIGFCFGGLSVIELLRSGANLCGIVAFHAVLGENMGEMQATLAPNAKKIYSSALILHGNDDPLAPPEDLKRLEKEFSDAAVDWQVHIYGNTVHAFTNPEASGETTKYQEKASKRSWLAMKNYFEEKFL